MKKVCSLALIFGLMLSMSMPLYAMSTPQGTGAATTVAPTRPMLVMLNTARDLLKHYPYVVAFAVIGAAVGYIVQLNFPVKAKLASFLSKPTTPEISVKTAKK